MTKVERFGEVTVLDLDVTGFDKLTLQQKNLAFYLSEAGMCGRFISLQQGSKYNLSVLKALMSLQETNFKSKAKKVVTAKQKVEDYLKLFFVHNGIYHSMSGQKLPVLFSQEDLSTLKTDETTESVELLSKVLLSDLVAEYRTVQEDGVDVVKVSGGNFYDGLTTDEVKEFRKKEYPSHSVDLNTFAEKMKTAKNEKQQLKLAAKLVKEIEHSEQIPPYGFNERLVKTESGIDRQVIYKDGLYGQYVQKIIENLTKALEFAESKKQRKSIKTLIKFYETGSAADFDAHCVAWTKDQDSSVYFINGLIESYEDPLGIGCTFESIVAFKNPEQTEKVEKITKNIQWFEDNMPFAKEFKKEKATGLSASSITVIGMAGDTSPTLPLGINLPNSDWIRKVHGSKSVNLANVASSRSKNDTSLRDELFLPEYIEVISKYAAETNSLHTDLHEIAGHGSGKLAAGVSTEVIGAFYSVIEETRADLVGLYYIGSSKLQELGVIGAEVNLEDYAKAQYVSYLTNGVLGQLRRVSLGNNLTQAHFRNRQLISTWILEKASESKVAEIVVVNGKHYVKVNDVEGVKVLVGELLKEIQRIKSTGDFEAAKNIVETYGTKVDQEIHKEVLERISKLDIPNVVAFKTPLMVKDGSDYVIKFHEDFLSEQLSLSKQYMLD